MLTKDSITARQRILLWLNRIRFSFRVRKKGWRIQVVIPDRYKRLVSGIKLLATLVGLFSAFIAFQSVLVAFLFGLGIFGLTSVAERILFSYTNFYVQPMPDFEIENKKWLGAFFGFAQQDGNPHDIPLVGMILEDEDYAKKICSILFSWTNNEVNDKDRHVCVSAVVLDANRYILFVYPSMHRHHAKEFFDAAEDKRSKETPKDIPLRLYGQLTLGKECEITKKSYFPAFRKRYKPDVPFLFQLGLSGTNGEITQINGVPDFIFYDLKIIERADLTRKDIEYDLVRILGG